MSFTRSVFMELQLSIPRSNIEFLSRTVEIPNERLNYCKIGDIIHSHNNSPLYNSLTEYLPNSLQYVYPEQVRAEHKIQARNFVIDKLKSAFILLGNYKVLALLKPSLLFDVLCVPAHSKSGCIYYGMLSSLYDPDGKCWVIFANLSIRYPDNQVQYLFEAHIPEIPNTIIYWEIDQIITFVNQQQIFHDLGLIHTITLPNVINQIKKSMHGLRVQHSEVKIRKPNNEDKNLDSIFKAAKLFTY